MFRFMTYRPRLQSWRYNPLVARPRLSLHPPRCLPTHTHHAHATTFSLHIHATPISSRDRHNVNSSNLGGRRGMQKTSMASCDIGASSVSCVWYKYTPCGPETYWLRVRGKRRGVFGDLVRAKERRFWLNGSKFVSCRDGSHNHDCNRGAKIVTKKN